MAVLKQLQITLLEARRAQLIAQHNLNIAQIDDQIARLNADPAPQA